MSTMDETWLRAVEVRARSRAHPPTRQEVLALVAEVRRLRIEYEAAMETLRDADRDRHEWRAEERRLRVLLGQLADAADCIDWDYEWSRGEHDALLAECRAEGKDEPGGD